MAIAASDKHPKVPCCTLLVRIVPAAKSEDGTKNLSQHDTGVEPAQWEDLGLLVPSKGYKDGDYDSVLALPSVSEEELYKYRSKQQPITLRDRAEKAKRSAKVDKWDNKTVDDKELIAWVSLCCCVCAVVCRASQCCLVPLLFLLTQVVAISPNLSFFNNLMAVFVSVVSECHPNHKTCCTLKVSSRTTKMLVLKLK